METFNASVQYNDLKGTAAADRADQVDATRWLITNGHMEENEHISGISMWAGENHGTHRDPISVDFLITERGSSDVEPVELKKLTIRMDLSQFFSLFKRLEITLSDNGDFEGTTFTTKE